MSRPIDPQAAMEQIWTIAPRYAAAKASATYLDAYLKVKRATLMRESPESTASAKESDALAHPEYLEVLTGLRVAIEEAETLRWRLTSAQAAIEIWRTQEASNRTIDKATR